MLVIKHLGSNHFIKPKVFNNFDSRLGDLIIFSWGYCEVHFFVHEVHEIYLTFENRTCT